MSLQQKGAFNEFWLPACIQSLQYGPILLAMDWPAASGEPKWTHGVILFLVGFEEQYNHLN